MEPYHDLYQSLSMHSDSDSRHLGLTFDSVSSRLPSTFYKGYRLRTYDEIHQSLPLHKAQLIPVEIFSEIFLYMVQADPSCRAKLMLVCRHWYDIMLSTPGIQSQMRIHGRTMTQEIERFGRRWLLDVTVGQNFNLEIGHWGGWYSHRTVEFHACFMAAAEAASRWRSLALLSLPPPGKYKDLQIMHPLEHLESFKLDACCDLGNSLEPLLSAITTTVTPRFTVMEVFRPDATLYLLKSAHTQLFSSLTTLRLIGRRTQTNPVDILPSLHKLEIFEAHHLFFPMYPPGVDLPLVQTLRVLYLKAVSVQWMAGRVFLALGECSIIFPHHADAIQSVYMPSCSILKYDSNNLGALEHFHIYHLEKLEIKCCQERTSMGTRQLAALHPIFAAQSLNCLHLEIKCSERLLAYMLRLVPALEELWMGLSSPHVLSSAFFLEFAAGGRNPGPSGQTTASLCRNLRKLHLHYKRWLRGPEKNSLIPAFGAVVASHPPEEQNFSFRLSFDGGSESQEWIIHEPAGKLDIELESKTIVIGVSSPDGIVPLSRVAANDYYSLGSLTELGCLPLPREAEYISTTVPMAFPLEFLFSFHTLKEVRMTASSLRMQPNTKFSLSAPLFHTLKVLHVSSISSSFFAGQIFHKLERYKEERIYDKHTSKLGPLTEMPVCTRLVVSLFTLATLKLPQIRELCIANVGIGDHIWKKHIAVNANLPGLKLLHVLHLWEPSSITFITILGLLLGLKSLIIGVGSYSSSFVDWLEAFVPVNVPMPSGPNQLSRVGQISKVLCPRLENLQIEGINLTKEAELMPVLKDIVTLRAAIGSPLKSFTFYFPVRPGPQKWQLIGRDKSFMMEEVVPAEEFRLDI